ncbi:hypothetical protein BJ684DRAFT_19178 [Piptocephalis cylindrospora]|uniref:Uncharacterized protein n=1 Tax=Piptocephalis cylindrospora TaxID=1907219 RepID=A0A4P9Y6U1_9FUNG|nr:hypothetical protein BJ684DRAFT_19178 [Piptocephalis cylindrospora]|eukprot:RKP14414.1 hypothetical protein BJ684DRAFT_19178 [Piptocephalis cylindrospora]
MSVSPHLLPNPPSQVHSTFHQEPPRRNLLDLTVSIDPLDYKKLSPLQRQAKYRPYNQIYAGLFFMVAGQLDDDSDVPTSPAPGMGPYDRSKDADTKKELLLFNKVARYHQRLAREACDKIPRPTAANAEDILFLRSPGSLVDSYCNVMVKEFGPNPYVSLVKDLRKAIGFSKFLPEQKGPDSFDEGLKVRAFLMKFDAEAIGQNRQIGVSRREIKISPVDLRHYLQVAIQSLIMERFYLKSHIPFGSLDKTLLYLRAVMRFFYREDILSEDDPTDVRRAEQIMLKKWHSTKAAANVPAVQDPSHVKSPASLVKNFGDAFLFEKNLPILSSNDITNFLTEMCNQVDHQLPEVIRKHKRGGRNRLVRVFRSATRLTHYFYICRDDHFKKAWTSENQRNWHSYIDARSLLDKALGFKWIDKYLEEWIYKVRFLQLVRYLQPYLVTLPIIKERWNPIIDTASKHVRTFVTSIYIHAVFAKRAPAFYSRILPQYQDMLNSISDDSFLTWNKESEEKALTSLRVAAPMAVKMESEMASSYKGTFGKFWAKLRGKKAWVKWCNKGAAKALYNGLKWASTPKGLSAPKNPAKTFAQYTVALKIFLLEAHKGQPIEISDRALYVETVKDTLSSKKP